MRRFKLTIEYDGRELVGWQRQENGPSVQQAIEEAIEAFSGETVRLYGAGRTDSGVHAIGQIAHFDMVKAVDTETVRDALNHHLRPAAIAVLGVEAVAPDFDARGSATRRAYLYRIVNRRAPLTLDRGRAWQLPQRLDAAAMDAAAQVLVGHHDFTSFRATGCQAKSPIKTLDRLDVYRQGVEIFIIAEALSFLHNQVRIIAGTLVQVGEGRWGTEDMIAALGARARAAAGPTAPPDGLYLTKVVYS